MYQPTRETARHHAVKVVVCSVSVILAMPNGSVVVLKKGSSR